MCNLYCLWESMHPLSYPCEYVTIVHLVIEVVFVYELLLYHVYMYYYIYCSIHLIFQVKIFYVNAHVS